MSRILYISAANCDRKHLENSKIGLENWIFSARYNIYISRLCHDASPSVCLWRLCTVVTGCDGSRISLLSWIDGCLYYLRTTPDPDCRMGWCRDFWWKRGVWKKWYHLFYLFFYRWTVTTWRICLHERAYERYWIFFGNFGRKCIVRRRYD